MQKFLIVFLFCCLILVVCFLLGQQQLEYKKIKSICEENCTTFLDTIDFNCANSCFSWKTK
jgi:hypothetical protein